jgi:hypothetical protein
MLLTLSMSRRRTVILVLSAIVVAVGLCGIAYYKGKYPYGESHCCIIGMSMALENFSRDNGGFYPAGQSSPEASLSLLYRSNYIDAATLRGMIIPEKTVQQILESGGLLGPDSSGWHYTPGLTRADNPELALLWCKEGLNHFGQRTDGGRQVVFIGNDIRWIKGGEWHEFVRKQDELLKHRSARALNGWPLLTGTIELPDGTRTNDVQVSWRMEEQTKERDSEGSGSSSGTGSLGDELVSYQSLIQNGTLTRTLSFSGLVSDPVIIVFSNGIPNVTNYTFKMRSRH